GKAPEEPVPRLAGHVDHDLRASLALDHAELAERGGRTLRSRGRRQRCENGKGEDQRTHTASFRRLPMRLRRVRIAWERICEMRDSVRFRIAAIWCSFSSS